MTGELHQATGELPNQGIYSNLGPGAHQCWYPVALSSELPKAKSVGLDLGDGRIVVYRGEDGKLRAVSAYCRHMGADLSVGGEVIGNNIRCPYHHWAFGEGGKCQNIPSGDRIPRGSSLANLPVDEQHGLIWVFFGDKPLYDIPMFGDFDNTQHVYRACEVKLCEKLQVEPWIFSTNVFDAVHLRLLHGLDFVGSDLKELSPYHRRLTMHAADLGGKGTGGTWHVEVDVLGINCVRTKGEMDGRLKWYIAAQTPCGRQGTRTFLSIITTKGEGGADAFFDRAEAMHTRLVNEDIPILNNMRYGNLRLVHADLAMGRFIRAARKYPRTTLDALETAANGTEQRQDCA